jgi:hypothetical protein
MSGSRPANIRRNRQFAYFLSVLLPHLPGLFPSSVAHKAAFGPGAYLLGNPVDRLNHDMERREAEVWGLAAAYVLFGIRTKALLIFRLAVNAPEEEQTNLVGALRETVRVPRVDWRIWLTGRFSILCRARDRPRHLLSRPSSS